MALPNMGDQFRGLPMADLIGGPLMASADAQVKLANATADFIKVIGFMPPKDPRTRSETSVTYSFASTAQPLQPARSPLGRRYRSKR
jgi:hypothetical protein